MRVALENGLEAQTVVRLLWYDEKQNESTVLLKPKTGRRHQLRVHLMSIGHPIVGDMTYEVAQAEK